MPYNYPRVFLYVLLFAASVVELGLTAYRVHFTKSNFHSYEPIVVELLVTAILAVIWSPITLAIAAGNAKESGVTNTSPLIIENVGNFVIWLMYLVGGAIITHQYPNPRLAGGLKQGHILLTIVAFSWISFGFLSLAYILSLMQYAARKAVNDSGRSGAQTIKA